MALFCKPSLCATNRSRPFFLPRRAKVPKVSLKQSRAALREDSSVKNTPSNKIKSCTASTVFEVRARRHSSSWQGFETSPTKHPTKDDISHRGVNVVSSVSVLSVFITGVLPSLYNQSTRRSNPSSVTLQSSSPLTHTSACTKKKV